MTDVNFTHRRTGVLYIKSSGPINWFYQILQCVGNFVALDITVAWIPNQLNRFLFVEWFLVSYFYLYLVLSDVFERKTISCGHAS